MEEFIINDIISIARANGSSCVYTEYIATPKNAMVSDFYDRMGFIRNGNQYADISTFKSLQDKYWGITMTKEEVFSALDEVFSRRI